MRIAIVLAAASLALSAAVASASYDGFVVMSSDDYPFFVGNATLHIDDSNVLTVNLTVSGVDADVCLPSHVQTGDCASMDTTEIFDLDDLCTDAAGAGSQSSTISLTPDQTQDLLTLPHHLLLHTAAHIDSPVSHKGRTQPIINHTDIGCGDFTFDAVPVRARSWGAVKSLYR